MSLFDSDPSFGGPSFEEMNVYNEVVLHAGEVAEAMQSEDAVANDCFYSVNDPRIMQALTITDTIRHIGHVSPDEYPTDVSLHLTVHRSNGRTYGDSRVHIDYAGERFFIRADEAAHYLVADVPLNEDDSEPYVTIDPRITSNLIAKLAIPYTSPELCDFTNINDISRISELNASLGASEFVNGSIEQTYEFDDGITVIIQTRKEALVDHVIPDSIQIVEDRGGDTRPFTLTVEFTDYANAAGLMKLTSEGSEEVELDVDHMRHFSEVMRTLLKRIRPESVSLEDYETETDEDERY